MIVVSVRLIFDLLFQGDKKERMFFTRPFYANELSLLFSTHSNTAQWFSAIIDKTCEKRKRLICSNFKRFQP